MNPLPVTLTCEMLTGVLPVLVNVTPLEALVVPTRTLPKFKLAALAESSSVCAVPVPLSAIVALGALAALLKMVTLPAALPAATGENETVNAALWPAGTVAGKASPPAEKPVPLALACEMLRSAVPVFVSTTDCDALLPTSTLPSARDAELSEIAGASVVVGVVVVEVEVVGTVVGAAPTPVPETGIIFTPPDVRLSEKLMLPENVPAPFGPNTTRNDAPWPGATVAGKAGPETAN